jgi:hypothetical protein
MVGLPKFQPRILPRDQQHKERDYYNAILRQEAKLGGEIFGALPKGRQRQFFCLDERTWVWYEEWTDASGQRHAINTHYHVRPDGILKSQGDQVYRRPDRNELLNLYRAIKLYGQRVVPALEARLAQL